MGLFAHQVSSLAQLPGLDGMLGVCDSFDIEITAFGSLVRRVASYLCSEPSAIEPSLFDLAPFLSDIDIVHSGPARLTPDIRRAIAEAVPFSEFFRWEIYSAEELREFRDDEEHLPLIPVNKMSLSTRTSTGIVDPFHGIDDLRSGRFRLIRSPFASRSTLVASDKACELLYALSYLRILCDEIPPQALESQDPGLVSDVSLETQPGWSAVREIAEYSTKRATMASLEESAVLRARLRYRSDALRASCSASRIWRRIWGEGGPLHEVARQYQTRWPNMFPFVSDEHGCARDLVVSCRLKGDQFRLNDKTVLPSGDENAALQWHNTYSQRTAAHHVTTYPIPKLPEGYVIVADVPEFSLNPGNTPSSADNEHLHFQVPISSACAANCRRIGADGLGGFLLLTATREELAGVSTMWSVALPVACSCWLEKVDEQDILRIRAGCGRVLEVVPPSIAPPHEVGVDGYRAKLFVVGDER